MPLKNQGQTKAGFASEQYVWEKDDLEKRALAGNNRLAFEILTKYIPQDGSCSTEDELLFSETIGRFVVTVDPKQQGQFEKLMKDVPYARIGNVINKNEREGSVVHNLGKGNQLLDMDTLREKWKEPLGFGQDNYNREVL